MGSQAVQEICERHEAAYERFFKKQGGLPRFKKVRKFRSFVLKQVAWKLHDETPNKKHRKITIDKTIYKFVYHRPMQGEIKTVSVKCDHYDVMVFEDLNLVGMKALWGRKVSDLGFAQFMQIVEWLAFKRGKKESSR